MEYIIVYQKRKSIGIYVFPDGQVEVRVPLHCSKERIALAVTGKRDWIQQRLRMVQTCQEQLGRPPRFLRVMGEQYPIQPCAQGDVRFDLGQKRVFLPGEKPLQTLRPAIEKAYRQLAKEVLPGRVQKWAEHFGLVVTQVKVTGARERWGSCSSCGSINFSWRLMMASPAAIDSVIIHELMHLIQPNHSPAFRRLERENTPQYEACQRELRELAQALQKEGWL